MKLLINSKFLLSIIFFLLILIPIVIQGNLYYVGGDDTRLYYIYPEEFLNNFTFNIISDNTLGGANTGYSGNTHLAPLFITIYFLKKALPFVNTQSLMYGLNYAFGFLFFYLFISIWFKTKNTYQFWSTVVASLLYVFSPLLVGTLYRNQLMAMYLIALISQLFLESSIHSLISRPILMQSSMQLNRLML